MCMKTFKKVERLCSNNLITSLFVLGKGVMSYPFSVRWKFCEAALIPFQSQVLITVSKKRFKHAVDRNRIKRLGRECYRLNKSELYELLQTKDCKIIFSISYIHSDILDYRTLQKKYLKMLSLLKNDIEKQQ